ncbi:MAG: 30S ribosome-binding factor RbfA [Candidatus Omnitrophica bacterium]|nr:30S ribosome-binding factor RbfA [Candidatus Omnitrophota bacterium]
MSKTRIDKLNKEIRHLISMIILQKMQDPKTGLVTITHVSVSPDLKNALVYFTCLGDDAKKAQTAQALRKASGYIKKMLSANLRIRFMPDLKFKYDDTAEQQERIDKIFEQINIQENECLPSPSAGEEAGNGKEGLGE